MARDLTWQPSLLDGSVVELDRSFHGGRRHALDEDAWVDHVPGWCRGADLLFAELLQNTPWGGREVRMYDRVVPEPRLTHRWHLDRGPDPPPALTAMARLIGTRYGVQLTQVDGTSTEAVGAAGRTWSRSAWQARGQGVATTVTARQPRSPAADATWRHSVVLPMPAGPRIANTSRPYGAVGQPWIPLSRAGNAAYAVAGLISAAGAADTSEQMVRSPGRCRSWV